MDVDDDDDFYAPDDAPTSTEQPEKSAVAQNEVKQEDEDEDLEEGEQEDEDEDEDSDSVCYS